MREWTISLNDYQRSNLLRMLNSFGAPYGNPWHNRELSQLVSVDTGDWFGEVAYLLGGVLQPGESVYGCRPPEPGFMVKALQAEVERLRAERDAVDAMHQPVGKPAECCSCLKVWPCRTHLLLHPEEVCREQ